MADTETSLDLEWLDLPDVADRLNLSVAQVRRLVRDGQLLAVPVAGRSGPHMPALFLSDGELVKGLTGTLTLLRDARYAPDEAIRWLFRPDDSLPGRPIDALREDRGTEVRRRAQALA